MWTSIVQRGADVMWTVGTALRRIGLTGGRLQQGQDLVEYALLIMLIVVIAVVAIPPLGTWVAAQFDVVHTAFST